MICHAVGSVLWTKCVLIPTLDDGGLVSICWRRCSIETMAVGLTGRQQLPLSRESYCSLGRAQCLNGSELNEIPTNEGSCRND